MWTKTSDDRYIVCARKLFRKVVADHELGKKREYGSKERCA